MPGQPDPDPFDGIAFRANGWTPPDVSVEPTVDGGWIVRNNTVLPDEPRNISREVLRRAALHPDVVMIGERAGDGWATHTWAEVAADARRVGTALLARGVSQDRAVAVLSDNSCRHWTLMHGALMIGAPCASVSIHYSLLVGARPKLHHVISTVRPALVYADDLRTYGPALEELAAAGLLDGVEIVTDDGAPLAGRATTRFDELLATPADETAVDAALAAVTDAHHARYLFTSGSTGMPKGVIMTHGMLAGLMRASLAMRNRGDSVYCDWMPWSHAGAGFGRLAHVSATGASLYIDDGRPTPDRFARTLENVRSVRPTHYVGAPVAWNLLVDAMERDAELCSAFFTRIREVQYGSAAMAQSTYERLQALAIRELGERLVMQVGYGASESILICMVWWPTLRMGQMGLPVPGNSVKLAPVDAKFELRLKGPMVTPGYLRRPDLTAAAFDDDGWYRTGDAARWADPNDPSAGLVFDGRIAEQFKLETGTWVSAGTLRLQVLSACAPLVRDVLVCGIDAHEVGVLLWPNEAECRTVASDPSVSAGALASDVLVLDALQRGVEKHNATHPSSSTRVGRFAVLPDQPSMEHQEITEKGYVNQAVARDRRAADVARLFAASAGDPGVRVL